MPSIMDSRGRTYAPGHPDFMRVKVENLEGTVRELTRAVIGLQQHLNERDGMPLDWPGDTYEYEPFGR